MYPNTPHRKTFNLLILNLFLLITLLFFVQISHAASLNLSWNANSEEDLAGYKVYYGTSSGNYEEPIDAGNVTEYELSGLTEGVTYYIAITAYDNSDNESEKSDEVNGTPPDTQDPVITITAPTSSSTYSTSNSSIALSGTTSDNVGVTSVTWSNDRGGSGSASGTTSWSVSTINLQEGDNLITVTAHDAAGNTSTDTLTVTYTPPDTQDPVITITSPTSSPTYDTSNSTINIGGTASDNVGVTSVTWSNDKGGSGSASGTTSWSVSNINLVYGDNILTVTARDSAGNSDSDSITITYTLPPGSYTQEFGNAENSDHIGTVEDTFIKTNYDINYAASQLNTYTWPTNTISNAIIMQWDLLALPTDAYIQSAALSLYLIESGGDDPYTLSSHKIINHDPTITECNGYTYDGINPWTDSGLTPPLAQADIQSAVDSQDIDHTLGYKSWNITQIVRDWVSNPETNYGVLINSDPTANSDSYRYFTSSDDDNSSHRPKLIVTFFVGDDTEDPTITITDPVSSTSFETAENTIDLGGTAFDNLEVTEITWSNNRGGNGTASGTTNWSVDNITLQEGDNAITITARDAAGNTGTDTLTVTYTPPDTQDPVITITSPTSSSTYDTSNSTINIGGTASANVGVISVTWSNDRGGSGSASGSTSWTISSITLHCGSDNIITVTAEDAAGNSDTDTLTIDVRPCKPGGLSSN